MRTRIGFVSNSSSSSFVISGNEYASVFDLAKAMIGIREWDDDVELIKKIDESSLSKNTPISFSTCNEDTYIVMHDKNYHVQTCHNHNWWGFMDEGEKTLKGRMDVISPFSMSNTEGIDIHSRFTFWYPENDLVGHEIHSYYNPCSQCGGKVILAEVPSRNVSIPQCIKCGKQESVKMSRGILDCCNYTEMKTVSQLVKDRVLWCSVCGKIRSIGGNELVSERIINMFPE